MAFRLKLDFLCTIFIVYSFPEGEFNLTMMFQILLASGLGLIVYAGISTGDWKEFYQYFRQSRFVSSDT